MRKRTSKTWLISHDELQKALDTLNSIVAVCESFGINPYNGSSKPLRDRITSGEFDLTQFENNRTQHRKHIMYVLTKSNKVEAQFTENSPTARKDIKSHIIKNGLIPYSCKECNNDGTYNGKPLSLQLEHINGVNNDNRLENLCFLCPNCHSQTDTYAGKKLKKIKIYESIEDRSNRIESSRKFTVSKDELERLIATVPMTTIGKHFGVSDNAVRKRAMLLGIEVPKRKNRRN